MTTIKVDVAVRDRLASLASERGTTMAACSPRSPTGSNAKLSSRAPARSSTSSAWNAEAGSEPPRKHQSACSSFDSSFATSLSSTIHGYQVSGCAVVTKLAEARRKHERGWPDGGRLSGETEVPRVP
jgi:hypothetical protein